jgi:hypothetical protein
MNPIVLGAIVYLVLLVCAWTLAVAAGRGER